jgi:transcriptional regulator with XRE-family HTH domain
MTGDEIRSLRLRLGMEGTQFAQMLGVNVVTLYRWESAGAREVAIDPRSLQILAVTKQRIEQKRSSETTHLGKTIISALVAGGGLAGLFYLLSEVLEPSPVRRSGGAARPPSSKRRKGVRRR